MKSESNYIKVELIDGIIEASYKPIFIDIEIAKDVLKTRKSVTLDKSFPMLLNGIGIKGINKEARDFFSNPEASEGLTATALLVKSKLDTFFANFLIRVNINKSKIPIKLFTDRQEALNWLEKYK